MTPNEYQAAAWRTNISEPGFDLLDSDVMRIWMALGLAGEAGEVANVVKKDMLHRTLDVNGPDFVCDELGDVLWYVAGLASHYGLTLEEIMRANVKKLHARYPDGWPNR